MGGASSNLSCSVVMEEGWQKSTILPYTAKFKCEFVWCTEEKGDRKTTAILGVDENNVSLF
jgi:hypothetical protein